MTAEMSQLSNGLRVVTHTMPHLETVSLGVWVNAGARSESDNEHGISHLLEHMAFKGTPNHSARDIVEKIENVGGDLNAATSLETTTFYARVLRQDVALAVELLSDILQNSLFDENELRREREVIIQEIAAAQDCPDDVGFDLVHDAAFPNQTLGRTILGTADSVMRHGPDDLRDYLCRNYTADRAVLSAAGAVDHESIVREAERYFSGLKTANGVHFSPACYTGGVRLSDKPFEQSHVLIAFEGVCYRDFDFYTCQLLSNLLGGGMSSRLFQEIRENRGLCYSIYTFGWSLGDTGLFGIHAATGEEQVTELVNVVRDQLLRISNELPSDEELKRCKAQLKAGLLMSLESSGARCEQLARQVIAFGQPLEIEDLVAGVEAVDANKVRNLADRIFCQSKPSFASVGPVVGGPYFDELAQKFSFSECIIPV